jgi:transcriptional regulator with XRE-family HTH domain
MVNIGERLKNLRTERELSLDMLVADMNYKYPETNINKSMLSRWENGINDPSLEYAKNIASYFDVSLDYLIGLTDVRTPVRLMSRSRTIDKTFEVENNDCNIR